MAKRFRFRLEPVLKIRKSGRDEQRRVVAERVRAVRSAREAVSDLERGVTETLARARRTRGDAVIDVGLELQEQRWRLGLHRRIHRSTQQMAEANDSLAAARQELARRSRDVKAIEKLRERRWQAHRLAEARSERLDADEAASQAYVRRTGMASGVGIVMQT